MRSELIRHVVVAMAIAVGGYILSWNLLEYVQTRRGPWEVTFTTVSNTIPVMRIRQPALGIRGVDIIFCEEEVEQLLEPKTVTFDRPRTRPEWGDWVFDDLLFLPGTVTLQMFGHQVEMMPRVLKIDRREFPWKSGESIVLGVEKESPPAPDPVATAIVHD